MLLVYHVQIGKPMQPGRLTTELKMPRHTEDRKSLSLFRCKEILQK